VEETFFINYMSSVEFKIHESDLIYVPSTPKCLM
jgi:hypothetical protein